MAPFEFAVTIPPDGNFAAMVRDVVSHGARHAGSGEEAALAFGCRAEDVVRERLGGSGAAPPLTVTVRMEEGPLQVVITGIGSAVTLALDA
jgi:hypothetical protein